MGKYSSELLKVLLFFTSRVNFSLFTRVMPSEQSVNPSGKNSAIWFLLSSFDSSLVHFQQILAGNSNPFFFAYTHS